MSNQFLLPKVFHPELYTIWIRDLNINTNTFKGAVCINLKSLSSTNVIQLHTRDLVINEAWIEFGGNEKYVMVSQSYDKITEIVSMEFPIEITKDVQLFINYDGILQTNMSGFYRSDYKDVSTGEDRWMLSTQFEATDARRAFPCMDEPNLKSHFKVNITCDKSLTVLSNMPEESVETIKNLSTTTFYTSPLMSTYLVAWAIGHYDYIEDSTEKKIYPTLDGYDIRDGSSGTKGSLPIRLFTAKGKSHQGRFAMNVTRRVVDLFSELFEIPYPLPKLDIVCVESYSHNAMENFSLITFRPSAILYDGKDEDIPISEAAKKVAGVVCHEVAHQWFGNLVTMNWWDELWLNEGFATWVGNYAVAHLFPEWNISSLNMLDAREVALSLDSLEESHPIRVNVHDPKDIDQVFDTISYLKGCSVLQMLSGFLGEANFLKGVALYLRRNKFSNATMVDLFESISEVNDIDVLTRIKPWILELGYPVINVNSTSSLLNLTQERYTQRKDNNKKETSWWVPLMMTKDKVTEGKLEFDSSSLDIGNDGKFNFFNTDGYGFYRVNYQSAELLQNIIDNVANISSKSQIVLISDVASVNSFGDFFKLSSAIIKLGDLTDHCIWRLIIDKLSHMRTLIYNSSSVTTIEKFDNNVINLFEPFIDAAIAYLKNPSIVLQEDSTTKLDKAKIFDMILAFTGSLSHPRVVKAASEIYNSNKIHESNRLIILGTLLSQLDTEASLFEKITSKLSTATLSELETILTCLGKVRNEKLFKHVFDLLFKIETMNVQFLATAFGKNPYVQKSLIEYVEQNKDELLTRLKVNGIVISRFVSFSLPNISDVELFQKIQNIFEGEDVSLYDRNLRQIIEKIELNIALLKSFLPQVEEYFK
ncbi:hypothetical protein TPHA_0H01440 [Tetrapisispora phaffii CBS 4417]|uniref:Aminopeptidase n=1 Tax=Tetrapisispora phaffii (strain ATCC 24235 / CBS 4417 / NBRC 1672 / NRRL Y-8282 / UCD 70-5) TaxID=1071381 RepID=G8BX46_TETPH|nr:hypothetical protein TPHA_0H01440 [Tetrapisispora phaffii CBS 4417]CCE64350.1 hypothetical protein TPHA_0H01440 [Tetrapisispora phaffii CBS 4417]